VSISAYLVGGERVYAQTFVEKALSNGIALEMVGHKDWDSTPRGDVPLCDIVVVLKDVVSHKLRDWARSSCRAKGVKFCEVSQKIAVGLAGLRHVLQMGTDEVEQENRDLEIRLESYLGEALFNLHRTFSEYPEKYKLKAQKMGSRRGAISGLQESYVESMDVLLSSSKKKLKSSDDLERLFDSYRDILRKGLDENLVVEVKSVLLSWGILTAPVVGNKKSLTHIFTMLFGYYPEELSTLFDKPTTEEEPMTAEEEPMTAEEEPMPTPTLPIKKQIIEDIHADPFKVLGYLFSDPAEIHEAQGLTYPVQDFVDVMTELRTDFASRKRHSRQEYSRWQDTKFRWAQSLLKENPEINSFGRLRAIANPIWSSRISDKYSDILFPSTETTMSPTTPAPSTTTPAPSTPALSSHAVVTIGSLTITLTQGAEVYIGEITAGEVKVEGSALVEIEVYSGSTFKGVRITF